MPSVLDKPMLTVFAGPNGSGKSTAYHRFLDAGLDSGEYLNPDDIAAAMRSDNAGSQAIDLRAGREVIKRTRSLITRRQSFVRETTLAGREIGRSMESAKLAGYRVVLVFVAVCSPKASGWRVAVRVAKGWPRHRPARPAAKVSAIVRQRSRGCAQGGCSLLSGQHGTSSQAGGERFGRHGHFS